MPNSRLETIIQGLQYYWLPPELIQKILYLDAIPVIERAWLTMTDRLNRRIKCCFDNEYCIDIETFNPQRIKNRKMVAITGGKAMGKTHLIKNLLFQTRNNYNAGGIILNCSNYGKYSGILPDTCIHEDSENVPELYFINSYIEQNK